MVDYLLWICRDTDAMIDNNSQHMDKSHDKNSKTVMSPPSTKGIELNTKSRNTCTLYTYVCYVRDKMLSLTVNAKLGECV